MKGGLVAACVTSAALLGGCTDARLGYGQAEQVLAWTVDSYVALDPRRRGEVAEQLADFRKWHCVSQPIGYAAWVRAAAAEFEPGLTPERVAERVAGVEYFARLLMTEAVPRVAALLQRLSERQTRELERNLVHADRVAREKATQLHGAQGQARRTERMRALLERWLGPLNRLQRQLVADWSAAMQAVNGEVYASTALPANAVRAALRNRDDRGSLETALRALVLAPDRWWTPAGDPRFAANRRRTWELLAQVAARTDEAQRRHLIGKAESVAEALERLACHPPRARSGALP